MKKFSNNTYRVEFTDVVQLGVAIMDLPLPAVVTPQCPTVIVSRSFDLWFLWSPVKPFALFLSVSPEPHVRIWKQNII